MLEEEERKEREMEMLIGIGTVSAIAWAILGLVTATAPSVRPIVLVNLRELFKVS